MGNSFGLGLVLSFTDNASIGIGRVTNTIGQLEQAARNSANVLDALGNSLSALSSIGSTFSTLVTAPISGFLGKIMNWGVQRASSIEQLQISFSTLMGTAKDASQYLDRVMDYAKTTPFAFDDLAGVAQQLISYGVDANKVLSQTEDGFGGLLNAIGDWSGGSSSGMSGMRQISDILGKIVAVGKVDQTRLNSLNSAGLQASKIIGNLYNKTGEEADKFIKTMPAEQFISDLVKGIEEGTDGPNGVTPAMKGMIEKLKGTWEGAQDYFRSSLKNAGLSLMGAYKDEDGVKHYKFLETMTQSLNNISDSIKNIATVFQPIIDMVENFMLKGSELIKRISEAFADLDEESKRHIGNIVLTLTLLGPSLILLSRLGTLLLQTVGFIKTFTTSMGSITLVLTTLFFLMSTNFNRFGDSASDFITKFFGAIVSGMNMLKEANEDLKDFRIDVENGLGTFFDKVKLKTMQLITFFKALADAWTDNTITEEMYDKLDALGILEFFSNLLVFKDRITYFFIGFKNGMLDILETVREFFRGSIFEKFFNLIVEFLTKVSGGTREDFEAWGESFAKIFTAFAGISAIMPVLKNALGILTSIFSLFNVRGLVSGVGSIFSGIGGAVKSGASSLKDILNGLGAKEGGTSILDKLVSNERFANFTKATQLRELFDLMDENGLPYLEDVVRMQSNDITDNFMDYFYNTVSRYADDAVEGKGDSVINKLLFGGDDPEIFMADTDSLVEKMMKSIQDIATKDVSKFDVLNQIFQHPFDTLRRGWLELTDAISMKFSQLGGTLSTWIPKIVTLLTSPLGIILSIVAVMGVLYATNKEFRESVNELLGSVFGLLKVVWSILKPIFTTLVNLVKIVLPILKMGLDLIAAVLSPILQALARIIEILSPVLQVIILPLKFGLELLSKVIGKVAEAFQGMGEIFKLVCDSISFAFQTLFAVVLDPFIWIINKIIGGYNLIAKSKVGKKFGLSSIDTIDYIVPEWGGSNSSSSNSSSDEDSGFSLLPSGMSASDLKDYASGKIDDMKDTVGSYLGGSDNSNATSAGDINSNITIYASTGDEENMIKKIAKEMAMLYRKISIELYNNNGVRNTVAGKQQIEVFNLTTQAFEQASI